MRETDPGAVRSLRAILTQAQRAHRILRDLMYVARPPEPRPRFCQPEEIVRNCLRDLRDGADERGVRLVAEARGSEREGLGRPRRPPAPDRDPAPQRAGGHPEGGDRPG